MRWNSGGDMSGLYEVLLRVKKRSEVERCGQSVVIIAPVAQPQATISLQ